MKQNRFLGAILCVAVLLAGCGGSGDSEARNPNGTFSMELSPTADSGTGYAMAMEIDAEGGEIIGGYAHFIQSDLVSYHSDKVSGTASSGSINAIFHFGPYDVEVNASYSGVGWHGTYQVFEGKTVFEEGDLTINRTGSATKNIQGSWEGTIVVDGNLSFDLDVLQEGHFLEVEADIDGDFYFGGGTIVGKSVAIGMDLDGWDIWMYGTVNSNATKFNGEGVYGESFTFQLDKVVARPDSGATKLSR